LNFKKLSCNTDNGLKNSDEKSKPLENQRCINKVKISKKIISIERYKG